MDCQMKYDHQWLCIIVNVSLAVVRADKKVGFTLCFSDFSSILQKFIVQLFTSLNFSVKLFLSFHVLLSSTAPSIITETVFFYGIHWMEDGMNEMVHEKVIAVLLIVGDIEHNDRDVMNLA